MLEKQEVLLRAKAHYQNVSRGILKELLDGPIHQGPIKLMFRMSINELLKLTIHLTLSIYVHYMQRMLHLY